jgi:hypothetical protein
MVSGACTGGGGGDDDDDDEEEEEEEDDEEEDDDDDDAFAQIATLLVAFLSSWQLSLVMLGAMPFIAFLLSRIIGVSLNIRY